MYVTSLNHSESTQSLSCVNYVGLSNASVASRKADGKVSSIDEESSVDDGDDNDEDNYDEKDNDEDDNEEDDDQDGNDDDDYQRTFSL